MKRAFAAAALAALLCIGGSRGAEAQFGKIKKAMGDKAAQTAGVPTKKPVMMDRIDLTVADLQALEKGVAAEVAAAPAVMKQAEQDQKDRDQAQEKYHKDYEAYQKASEKYESCKEKLIAREQPQEDALVKKHEADVDKAQMGESEEAALEAKALKAQAAAQKVANGTATAEDRKALADFQNIGAELAAKGNAPMASANEATEFKKAQLGRIEKSCGGEPQQPASPAGGAKMASEQIKDAGSKAAGMDKGTYTKKREDLISYCGTGIMVAPSNPDASALNDGLKAACPRVAEMQKAGVPI